MKAKHALVLIIIGYCLNFIGALLKIMHNQEADPILIASTVLSIAGTLLFLGKVIKYPSFKDFMNS